jgi:hypothetical protein
MLHPCRDRLYFVFFELSLEFIVPIAIIMNSMRTEFCAPIQNEFSHGAEPLVPFLKFINNQHVVLDILELSTGKDHSGCVINDNADFQIRPTDSCQSICLADGL